MRDGKARMGIKMGVARKFVALLVVLVVLGNIIMPAMAVSNKQTECRSCNSCSNLENKNVAVFELKGLEKNKVLAKALTNEDVKKLIGVLAKKGYKQDLTKTRISKIFTSYGTGLLVVIPFKVEHNKLAGVIAFISDGHIESYAIELQKKSDVVLKKIYYVDSDGNLRVTTTTSGFSTCLWACIGWEVPACAITCAACGPNPLGIAACIGCALCIGKGMCCVGKCGEQEWGDPFCIAMDARCRLGNWIACIIHSGCEGYC